MQIAHIINPVKVGEHSDLFQAQPVTFASLLAAKQAAFEKEGIQVELLTTQYPEDHEVIPKGFSICDDLPRSILDVQSVDPPRKLPFIKDIINTLYSNSEGSDYLVYSNVDIAVMPAFYESLSNLIERGHDAFVINRRTISKDYAFPEDLKMMYMQAGEKHPGFDCFVFKRDLFPKIDLGEAIIGARWIGRIFVLNLIAASESFACFEDLHLTFHIGNDKVWTNDRFRPYDVWNTRQLLATVDYLKDDKNIKESSVATDLINRTLNIDKLPVDASHSKFSMKFLKEIFK